MTKTLTKIMGIFIVSVMFITLIGNSLAFAATDTASQHTFYNNPLNPDPEASTIDGSLEYFARFTAKNNNTGDTELSSKNWDTASNINTSSLVGNNADVYDMTNSSDLRLIAQVKNNSSAETSVSLLLELPYDLSILADSSRISGNPVTGNFGDTLRVEFKYNDAYYTYEKMIKIQDFDWGNVKQVWFKGTLGAEEVAKLDLPVSLQSGEPTTVNVGVRSYTPERQTTWLRIRASKFYYNIDDRLEQPYLGTYIESSNGVDRYQLVPDEIQALMPKPIKSDLIYEMFDNVYKAGEQADLTRSSDGVAYDHSVFLISTERIFNAVKDAGYSVFRDDVRGLWNAYAYNMKTGVQITDQNGNPVIPGTDDPKYYVELHKVLDAKDIVMYVDGAWDKFDNLTYRQSISKSSATSRELTDDEIEVTHNVDVTKPGVYTVKYSYEVDPGKYVTKTAKVTVLDKDLGKYTVEHKFVSVTDGKTIPTEVLDLLPAIQEDVETGTEVSATQPSKTKVQTDEGTWVFKGYDKDTITVQDKNETFTGSWEFVPKVEPVNESPSLVVKDKTIQVGDELNLKDLIVSAEDAEDGDLKDKVEIIDDGGFDKTNPGEYTITFKVTDSKGASATKTAIVTVQEKEVVVEKFDVVYKFVSISNGKTIPTEVLDLLPAIQEDVETGTEVSATQPSKTEVQTDEGTWVFKGYDKDTITVQDKNETFTGSWEFVPKPVPEQPGIILTPVGEGNKEREDHIAYIFGYPDKSVQPEGMLTRAEAAAMVTRLGKLDLSDRSKPNYPDLRDNAWYLGNINAALAAGMLDTDEAGNLRPNEPVTRGEFMKMIAAVDKHSDGKAPFTDITGHKYEKEINQVYGNRHAFGYEDGTFKPDSNLSRAEAAAFLNRVFNRVADDVAVQGLEDHLQTFTDLQKGTWFYYELVEATNSHRLERRGGQDEMNRDFEKWLKILR